jgi:uncharacterized metal-binding protein YceD (DUF177 family)
MNGGLAGNDGIVARMKPDMPPEFSHPVPLSEIGSKAVHVKLVASDEQRAALARRFDLLSLDALSANVSVRHENEGIMVEGRLEAELIQACVASGAPVPAKLSERFTIRFIPDPEHAPDVEIELEADDCDTIFHDGRVVDLGEAVAQTLGLAIDPYPRSAAANTALKKAGVKDEHEAGPFAALAALRAKQD